MIYHYHAQLQDGFNLVQIDGILICEKPIINMDRYAEIKKAICDEQTLQGKESRLVITSLSLLQEEASLSPSKRIEEFKSFVINNKLMEMLRTNNPNRNPHADMIHEWAETGRKVECSDDDGRSWCLVQEYEMPSWFPDCRYRWADEQPKPDVVMNACVGLLKTDLFTKLSACESNRGANCKFTFDADGNLKDVEKIK